MRENASNMHYHRNKKLVGTHLRKDTGRWSAKIYANGKEHWLGCYDTEIEAHNEYLKAKREFNVR